VIEPSAVGENHHRRPTAFGPPSPYLHPDRLTQNQLGRELPGFGPQVLVERRGFDLFEIQGPQTSVQHDLEGVSVDHPDHLGLEAPRRRSEGSGRGKSLERKTEKQHGGRTTTQGECKFVTATASRHRRSLLVRASSETPRNEGG